MNNIDFAYLYTSTEGRIGRQDFWIGVVGMVVASIVFALIVSLLFGLNSVVGRILTFIWQLVLAYPYYSLLAKRFQDRDKPATYAAVWVGIIVLYSFLNMFGLFGDPMSLNWLGMIVGLAVFVVAVWVLVECGFLRGTVGPNQYGPDPVEEPSRVMR